LDDLLENSHRLLNLALNNGAEEAEVFGFAGRSSDVDLRKDKVELASESFHSGLGLRAVVKGAVGFSCTCDLSQFGAVANSAVRSAKARGRDASWKSLALPKNIQHPEKIFDAALDKIEPELCLDLAAGMLRGCHKVKEVEPVSGGVTCLSIIETVVNSRGIEYAEQSTMMHASMEAIAKGIDVATGSEFHNSRLFRSDLQDVGKSAAVLARASRDAAKAESGIFEVLLKPLAFMQLLEYSFVPSLSADNVQKGRSRLATIMGKKIASEDFFMEDDGLLSGGIGSSSFDGEGVPSQNTPLIENGVLRSFLYDSYTAGKVGERSTGNAVRSGYTEVPKVGIRNLVVSSSESRDLIEETKGILVNDLIGAHTANPISGDFSLEAKNSFLVTPDETPKPIKSMMLAGNIFELLKDIEVGEDVRAVGAIVTPTVRIRMKVVV